MTRVSGDRIGRYVLDRRLGIGGMAEAWLAHQEGPAGFSKSVVVKVAHAQHVNDPNMVELFLREARVGARLNHQNLVQIFDLGEANGQYFIAMEYVDGLTLLQLTKRCWAIGHGIPMEVAVRVIAAAAQGLHHAHTLVGADGSAAGIIHRDISPDNIMIARDGAVKVLDFGVAKLTGTETTQSGEIKGKVPFMSPEQIDPEADVDARTDLWSLGVTLYWCLTGKRPFSGATDIHTIRAILESAPVPVRALNKAVPAELEELVLNLLDKDRDKRVANGQKLASKLLRLVPPAQHNPVARFMARMQHFDDDPPEAKAKTRTSGSGVGGLPATPLSGDSTDVMMRDATPHATLEQSGLAPAPPAEAARVEDVPSTVRLATVPLPSAQRSRRPFVAAAGTALVALVVTIVVVTQPPAAEEPAPPAEPPTAPTLAVEPPAPSPPDPSDANLDPLTVPPIDPTEIPTLPARARPRAPRTIAVAAPAHVRWLSPAGKVLGQGSKSLTVTDEALIALDTTRDGRTTVPVAARIDYDALPKGSLLVRVLPYATNVKLGSLALGPTPLKAVPLTAGTYRVVIEKDKQLVTRTVKVKAGAENLLTVDLRAPSK